MKGLVAALTLAFVATLSFGFGQAGLLNSNDNCPNGKCQRTVPFNATTAPTFEAPPAVGVAPVVNVDPAVAAPVVAPAVPVVQMVVPPTEEVKPGLSLTPEQKEALKSLLSQAITLLIGVFLTRGAGGPFFQSLLNALGGYLQNKTAPAAKTGRLAARRAAKKKTE